ncbi:MAG: DNA polymerase III subunit gamma/tau [Bacteroidetes bacterium]|nr:DNA polymerase III subunit gamma/tau [Bacteroidota bacterium]
MDKFIVSARKYRPQTFESVVGQSHISTTLLNAIRQQQLAHAFLFCGPRGVGKTTCARILAKTINCTNRTPEGEACDQCTNCRSFNEGASLNYFELDAASNNSVDQIRDLTEQVRFMPQSGTHKVYVIDEVHMLSASAFNAFLKTLEEPPPYAIFILATTEKHKILPTILSRCQIFDFKRITLRDTIDHLASICQKEKIQADENTLQLIAQKSEGCMRDALSLLDKLVSFSGGKLSYAQTLEHLNVLDADLYFQLMERLYQQQLSDALLLYDGIHQKGFEGDQFLSGLAEFIRNLLVSQDEKAAPLLDVAEGFKERYRKAAPQYNASYLVSALNLINQSEIHFRSARNKRLQVEMALIKLAYLQQALDLSSLPEGDKKKMTDSPLAFRIRPIRIATARTRSTTKPTDPKIEAKLILETPAKKVSSEPLKEPQSIQPPPTPNPKTIPASPKISALSKIRDQYAQQEKKDTENKKNSLEETELSTCWQQYTEKLRLKKDPALPSFERARLEVVAPTEFKVIVHNNIEQRFIEQERNPLYDFLTRHMPVAGLQFQVVAEAPDPSSAPTDVTTLSSRDQYLAMVAQYPLVETLKDKLGLDLDY